MSQQGLTGYIWPFAVIVPVSDTSPAISLAAGPVATHLTAAIINQRTAAEMEMLLHGESKRWSQICSHFAHFTHNVAVFHQVTQDEMR